jgi:hypothetical protein
MAAELQETAISFPALADVQAVADALASGKLLDPEVARRVRARAEQARRELLATRGVQEIGVSIIREIRGALPES